MEELLCNKDLQKVKETLLDGGFHRTDWEELGGELGLDRRTMEDIKADKGNINACFTECLSKWLDRADQVDERHGRPTMKSLAAALTKMGKKNEAEYISSKFGGNSSEGKKPAKSTGPKTDSPATKTSAGNKDGGAKARASDDEPDAGPTPQQSRPLLSTAKPQNSLSFMCRGWIILSLCFAGLAVVYVLIYLPPSYQQMKGKCEPNNKMYVHPEDVQVPLPTTASGKSLDISDLSDIISKLNNCKFDHSRWKDLCLNIGLYEVTINNIRSDEDNVSDRLRLCLVKWLNRVEDVDIKGGATWESLEKGLINIGQKPVAEKLRESRKNRNK